MLFDKKKKEIPDEEIRHRDCGMIDCTNYKEKDGCTLNCSCNIVSGAEPEDFLSRSNFYTPKPMTPEIKPEKQPRVIISTVKETSGYIEIVITCGDFYLNRESLIKKDQIVSIDKFHGYVGFDSRYIVLIETSCSKQSHGFERKEDAEQLYNALSKLLKKKDAKSAVSKKVSKAD